LPAGQSVFLAFQWVEFLDNSNTVQVNPSFPCHSFTWRIGHASLLPTADGMTLQVKQGAGAARPASCYRTLQADFLRAESQGYFVSSFRSIFWITLFDGAEIRQPFWKPPDIEQSRKPVEVYEKNHCSIVYSYIIPPYNMWNRRLKEMVQTGQAGFWSAFQST
jgi:hypothetical protein